MSDYDPDYGDGPQEPPREVEIEHRPTSDFDYEQSRRIAASDPSFASLIMAAMRKADSKNTILLRMTFPEMWDELEARYNPASQPACTCARTDPKFWTTHYGATEPGSQWEWDPGCPVHLPWVADDPSVLCGDSPAPCNCDDPTIHNGH